jgi:hypothetical protein
VAYTFKGSAGDVLALDIDELQWWYERACWIREQLEE